MLPETQRNIRHLFWRAGFGWKAQEMNKYSTVEKAVEDLFKTSRHIEKMELELDPPPSLQDLSGMEKQDIQKMVGEKRREVLEVNYAWLLRMASSEAQLREKMTLFWHDHFACQFKTARPAQLYFNTIHQHALENFGDLLLAVSKEPGMLLFLNNQQNTKEHPNENFGRELLELFTLGIGHYTEADIKEAARAFTGWSTLPTGEFIFRERRHDYGSKSFLGRKGNFDGEDIIKILLEQKRTAYFITEKIYAYFVNEKLDKEKISTWSKEFYESGYNIGKLMRTILSSPHFYAAENRENRIKSPIEYLVGLMRQLNAKFTAPEGALIIQRVLGQVLFNPPNVAGWPQGNAWIDSSTLIARLRIPQVLINSSEYDLAPKAAFAGNEEFTQNNQLNRRIDAEINWEPIRKLLAGLNPDLIRNTTIDYLLVTRPPEKEISKFLPNTQTEAGIRQMISRLVCTPEYQLC